MKTRAVSMVLLMIVSALAGCTSGDPDGDGELGIDTDVLNQMIEDNLQDFINNSSVTVHHTIHQHNNTTVVNNYYQTTNEYQNTTNVEGQDVTNHYANNYSLGGAIGGNGTGSNLYLLDMEFNLYDLMPELALLDPRNDSIHYTYTYYDYLTNSERTDEFTIQCSDYYIVGSQSSNNVQVPYWTDSNYYWDAWVDQYNQTIANMLQDAAYDNDVRQTCDESYSDTSNYYVHLVDLPIPSGMAISKNSNYYRLGFHPINEVWCGSDENGQWGTYSSHIHEGLGYYGCHYDWNQDGYNGYNSDDRWRASVFALYGELDWGLTSYEVLPMWIGGDEVSQLPLYVTGLEPGIQYRVVLYFELVSVTHHTE